MAETDEEKRRRRRRQQALVPPPTTPSTTVPAQTYLPPTRTPAAPSGTPTTSTTAAPTTTTAPPATLPPKSTTTSTAPKSTTTTTPKSPTTTAPKNTGPRSADGATSWREFEEQTSPKDDGKGNKGGKGGKGKGKETAPETPPAEPTLEENVRKFYPQFAYLLDNPELFGDDVIAVIKRAVKDGWTETRFKGSIMSTQYWQNTVQEAKNFDALTPADQDTKIQDTLDEINGVMDTSALDEAELTKFARDMARRGIKGEQLKKMTYGMALTAGADTEAAADVLASNDAVKIKRVVQMYGGSISDDTIKQYLTDGKTPEQVQMMYREKAKGLYPHLAPQLDADLTMDDITKDYKSMAASILEKTESEIDFTKPEFMEAIASDDGKGNKRQLSLGEWQKKLKTDDRYGYSKTTRAIQDARQMAFNISKAFGKVV